MDWSNWFLTQLQTSAEGFEWGFWQVPERLRRETPIDDKYMGLWPAVRHVWHVAEYERCVAMPSMRLWLGGDPLAEDAWPDDDATWDKHKSSTDKALIAHFWMVRRQEIALVNALQDVDWDTPRETGWGIKPLSWVVTKTYQHTFEHGDTLMRMGLWWEHIEGEIAKAQGRG